MTFILLCLIVAIFINNSIPYVSLPTMGQALWTMGYAKSLSNCGFFNIYAYDIGIPKPAAIAFGLSAVLPISWLIRFGMLPEAAYSLVFSIWLGVAFWGCYRFSRLFSTDHYIAALFAMLWLMTPIVTKHSGYSMLMLGIALLPFYCWIAYSFVNPINISFIKNIISGGLLFLSTLIAIFMDGYTYIMFAVAASGMMIFSFLYSENKIDFVCKKAPIFLFSFSVSYFLYTIFIGKTSFQPEPMDFFRGWGVDVSFLIIPTKGVFWLFDVLGLSDKRLASEYFGDASVWDTSFVLPFFIIGIVGWFSNYKKYKLINYFMVVGLFSIYMALGPSLKFYSIKPASYEALNTLTNTMLMPKEYAITETGNSFLSGHLPGFNVMRASYRWLALGIFCLWCMTIIAVRNSSKRLKYSIAIMLLFFYTPHIKNNWQYGRANFNSIGNINDRMISELKNGIPTSSRVAFIPWNNDFFANYLAPISGFKTFNIGGDKNLDEARRYWPLVMNNLQGSLSKDKVPFMVQLLLENNVDFIVVPYVNMLWSAHYWLCPSQTLLPLNDEMKASLTNDLHLLCPDVIKNELKGVIQTLREVPFLDISDRTFFAAIAIDQSKLKKYILAHQHSYPLQISQDNYALNEVLKSGFYYAENGHVWSKSQAEIELSTASKKNGFFNIKYSAFITDENNPVTVIFRTEFNGREIEFKKTITNSNSVITSIPIDANSNSQIVYLTVINAKSPLEAGVSLDSRVLGISLETVSIND